MRIEVETAILRHLHEHESCTIEELFRALARFPRNQVIFAIDQLSWEGKLRGLRHPTRFVYVVSAGSGTGNEVRP